METPNLDSCKEVGRTQLNNLLDILRQLKGELDNLFPGQIIPRTTRMQDNSHMGDLVPRTVCTQDNSNPQQLVPRSTRSQDNS